MKVTLSSILSYLIGVPLALIGLAVLGTSIPAGLVTLLTGLFLTPASRRRLLAPVDVEFSRGAVVGIVLIGVVASGVLVIGSMPETDPGEEISNVTTSAAAYDYEGAEYDDTPETHDLHITYNARAQSSVDPNPDSVTHYDSDDGEKYLVVRMEIENRGDLETELHGSMFQFESDNVVYDRQGMFGADGIGGVTLQPGGSTNGWVAFPIPEDTTEGTLEIDGENLYPEGMVVEWTTDESMAIDMAE